MPERIRSTEERLRAIELMLAGVLLSKEPRPEVKKLAKLIGVSDKTLTELFPQRGARLKARASEKTTNE